MKILLSIVFSFFCISQIHSATLKGTIKFKKRPAKAAIVYFKDDNSAKGPVYLDQKDTNFTNPNCRCKERGRSNFSKLR